MNYLVVKAGDVVVTEFGIYQHWSIVSDRLCALGKNMLISATKRTGTVQEETWDCVTQGKYTYVVALNTKKSVSQILADARSQIGRWIYSVTGNNCEHFVKWSLGKEVSSTQVKAFVSGAIVGGIVAATLSEKPKTINVLGGAVLGAGLGVLATKAERELDNQVTCKDFLFLKSPELKTNSHYELETQYPGFGFAFAFARRD